ncbi:MAG: hypothetical protein JXR37_16160, partial [Kiritimatiellae bacterium]|nr:hypothetical protein [Kiritimatiellia bacterium]
MHYVDVACTNAMAPYTNWWAAATAIQDAVDAAEAGDTVLVTNGVYASGEVVVAGTARNRVAVTNAMMVRSVEGPDATLIVGQGPIGSNAVRCAYLATGAELSGFTLTQGHTPDDGESFTNQSGGGVWCETGALVSNCVVKLNQARKCGGGCYKGNIFDSEIVSNSASWGAGVFDAAILHSVLSHNTASGSEIMEVMDNFPSSWVVWQPGVGGGAFLESVEAVHCEIYSNSAAHGAGAYLFSAGASLSNCEVCCNVAAGNGGGVLGGTFSKWQLVGGGSIIRCRIADNAAEFGGGVFNCEVSNSELRSNRALDSGGGAYLGTLCNSAVYLNSAQFGGGAYLSTLRNCTVTRNSAELGGGGTCRGEIFNSIVYYNESLGAHPNHLGGTYSSSCTAPSPVLGCNLTSAPLLSDVFRLSPESPCIGRGHSTACSGLDIDGEEWADPPSMGCDEYRAGTLTGELDVAIAAEWTNVATGCSVGFEGRFEGRFLGSVWDFDDGVVVSNTPCLDHAWSQVGEYSVILTGYNESLPEGVAATVTVHVVEQPVHYVDAAHGAAVYPYTNWSSAANTIQDAVDAALVAGSKVWVSNGVYATGAVVTPDGSLSNRVVIARKVVVQSTSGPENTFIDGQGPVGPDAVRCLYLGGGAELCGFTLTNGHTLSSGLAGPDMSGAGAFVAHGQLADCIVAGNAAAKNGGGVYRGTVIGSSLLGNAADWDGGGAYHTMLHDSILAGNSAGTNGGGVCYLPTSELPPIYVYIEPHGIVPLKIVTEGLGVRASFGAANNCRITGNSALFTGGGVAGGTIYGCEVVSNSAVTYAGISDTTALNCTIVGNTATYGILPGSTIANIVRNCIVYYNLPTNYEAGACWYSCTTPDPGGPGNITAEPLLRGASDGDYRLDPFSPCIDAGWLISDMTYATDLDGNPRVVNGSVDIGAYEFPMTLEVKVVLQGPYGTESGAMTPGLMAGGMLPAQAPYTADARVASAVPSNAVDWILVQLLRTNDFACVATRSVFLLPEGCVANDDGTSGLCMDAAPGVYHVVVRHRNHLPCMSAEPVALTNGLAAYDFSTGCDKYYGGTNACVELEPGVWGLVAGDADGDGAVLGVDALIWACQSSATGYHRGDFDLDGAVTSADSDMIWAVNQGRASSMPGPVTALSPALRVAPARLTLLSGQSNTLYAAGSTNVISWAFVKNPSGGFLSGSNGASVLYEPGATSACTDVVEAWAADNRLGRASINVISPDDVTAAGKAVIVAGRKGADDPLWPNTDYLADIAYNTLLYRGYSEENLQYLSPVTGQDVDGDGASDDIDHETTYANVEWALTNWANSTSNLFVYLVDHGADSAGVGYFRLNPSETLPAAELDAWLDDIQDTYQTRVTVLIDCCYAAGLLDELAYTGTAERIVIACCATNEPAYFVAGGLVSFSDAFYNGMLLGYDLAACYALASSAMAPYQTAGYSDTGGGSLAGGLYLGADFVAAKGIPRIGTVCGNQLLSGNVTASVWADDVAADEDVVRVWCLVVPPDHDPDPALPVAEIPEIDLADQEGTGRYSAQYGGLGEEGTYKVIYYARDACDGVSLPVQRYIYQQGYKERAVLVNGGLTNSVAWAAMQHIARHAYLTLLSRRFEAENIYYISAEPNQDVDSDGTNDVDATPALTNVQFAITDWAATTNCGGPAAKLTVYLIGEASNNTLSLNVTETLDAATLDYWLDTYQSAHEPSAIVILEFAGAGGFIPDLMPPPNCERITIACAAENAGCAWPANGRLSFSGAFLSHIFNGRTVGYAFAQAKECVRRVSGRICQTPLLDETGDGVPDDTPALSLSRYIGSPFVTGADSPEIGTLMDDTE